MGFFDRMANLWKGFLSIWVSDIESKNPEAVYEAAIEERVRKHRELKKAVSGIVYLRNKLQGELEQAQKELREIEVQIPIAVEENADEVALVLLQKKEELVAKIDTTNAELTKIAAQAEEAKSGLIAFQGEIEKLKREKESMLAKKANADARIQIQETLNGLSTDADIKALEGVRENINKKQAEADVGAEIQGSSLDAKLAAIKSRAASATANSQLAELKRQSAARKAGSTVTATAAATSQATEAASVKKTI